MEDQESIANYFTRIRTLINVMKGCGEKILEQSIVEKILRTLSAKFHHVVVAIEESKDLENLKIDELQGSLEARRKTDEEKSCHTGRGFPRKNSTDLSHDVESGNARKGNHKFSGKKKKDQSKIQCFNYKKWGHFASDCKLGMKSKDAEASLAKEEDSDEDVLLTTEGEVTDLEISTLDEKLLMVTTKGDQQSSSINWYLDTRCSNHMTGHKEWFVSFDDSVKTKVRFADDSDIRGNWQGDDKKEIWNNLIYIKCTICAKDEE
ncbi:PREDICTED: uncharacterized protein LOC109338443 [Lupinus angustifolius]|uniref:uncharacterized protein LOC109338443 n=1 Tax=Lupinus angustifolius TaxID=3871 RepID=UPI00092EC0AC|nr:PREDICTED: uncharacterized protein LOC109338443 [Lupinus angustifolius]